MQAVLTLIKCVFIVCVDGLELQVGRLFALVMKLIQIIIWESASRNVISSKSQRQARRA